MLTQIILLTRITYLKWYQYAVLCLMNANILFLWIASRGMGKTFITAIFSCVRCILYPGSKVALTSGTRGQALQILEKIQTELIPRSPNLKNEIDFKETKFSGQDAKIMFKNGSYIKVVTAADSARGNRAILSADIALMSSKKHNNDATAIFINQMLPTKAGRYTSNIVYSDTFEGLHTARQKSLCKRRQATVKGRGANREFVQTGRSPA